MANTTIVNLTTTWTNIASSGSGFITNEGINPVNYRESDSTPIDDIGHTLGIGRGEYVSFNIITSGQNIFAKTSVGVGRVAVTQD